MFPTIRLVQGRLVCHSYTIRCELPRTGLATMLAQILDLYHRSFPLSERRPDAAIEASLASLHYRPFTKIVDDKLAGFALLFAPAGETFALLEYLAVEPTMQGKGIGTELVRNAIAAVPDRWVLFEVEAESIGELAKRRQQFYRRCGCSRIQGLHYRLPLPNDPPPMELMVHSAERLAGAIDRDRLIRSLRRIYMDVYGCQPDDPRLLQTISDLQR